jgi:GGDEF domain-containing protein
MSPRPRSCLSTPLTTGEILVGVLALYSSNKDAYSEEHERIIEVIARQVSGAIRDACAAERKRSLSFKDETTGLPNLNHLIKFVDVQLSQTDRHPFCLLVIRIGGAGPTALAEIESSVAAVRRTLRPADLLFRSGLDELAVLLLNTERPAADVIASRVEASLEQLKAGRAIVSFRIGSVFGPSDAVGEHLLRLARERAATINPPEPPKAIH